jgi:hypothetical protein
VPLSYQPQLVVSEACPNLRIALLNGVDFHFEVLSGLLHVLQPYEKQLHVYLSPHKENATFHGAWDLIRWASKVLHARPPDMHAGPDPPLCCWLQASWRTTDAVEVPIYDILILVSPDYEFLAHEALIKRMKPSLTLAIIHNPSWQHLPKMMAMFPKLQLLALAPHVASALARTSKRNTDWLLAVYPVPVHENCMATDPKLVCARPLMSATGRVGCGTLH